MLTKLEMCDVTSRRVDIAARNLAASVDGTYRGGESNLREWLLSDLEEYRKAHAEWSKAVDDLLEEPTTAAMEVCNDCGKGVSDCATFGCAKREAVSDDV